MLAVRRAVALRPVLPLAPRAYSTLNEEEERIPRRMISKMNRLRLLARTSSVPMAVRERREQALGRKLNFRESDANEHGSTPTDAARYARFDAIASEQVQGKSEKEWVKERNARRSRIRGIVPRRSGPAGEVDVVGQRIYLPNVTFRLVRNQTRRRSTSEKQQLDQFNKDGSRKTQQQLMNEEMHQHEPYNPYEATFRVPKNITKTDIRSYLLSVYGVKTTYIRTDINLSEVLRSKDLSWTRTIRHKTYKRAVVGLVDPFYYPLAKEDMATDERAARVDWIEENFAPTRLEELKKENLLRMTRKSSKTWRWQGVGPNRENILVNIAEKRKLRDRFVERLVDQTVARRDSGRKWSVKELEGLQHPKVESYKAAIAEKAKVRIA